MYFIFFAARAVSRAVHELNNEDDITLLTPPSVFSAMSANGNSALPGAPESFCSPHSAASRRRDLRVFISQIYFSPAMAGPNSCSSLKFYSRSIFQWFAHDSTIFSVFHMSLASS